MKIVEFSHHDLGWHKSGYRAEADFVNYEINKALDLMNEDKEYKFCWTHEHVEFIYQYLLDHGERYEELKKRMLEGRFEVGTGYSSPYTSFVTAEILVRQMIYGKKWVDDMFPGYKANVFYNTDIPGMTMQLPQILRKSGVEYLYLSRSWTFDNFRSNEFLTWYSPDGTGILTHFMKHYGDNIWDDKTIPYVEKRVIDYNYKNPMLLMAMDCTPPMDLNGLLSDWAKFRTFNANKDKNLPTLDYSTYQNSIKDIFAENEFLQELKGEWPNKWLYENVASDYNCFLNQREAERKLRFAEMLGVILGIAKGTFEDYDAGAIENAWRYTTHSCHGFAPAQPIEDFRRRYSMAHDMANTILNEKMETLANAITTKDQGEAVVIFHPNVYSKKDVVSVKLPETYENVVVKSSNGEVLNSQIDEDGLLHIETILPSAGFSTVYLQGIEKVAADLTGISDTVYENEFYAIELNESGIKRVYDKEFKEELFINEKFNPGELVEMTYNGCGAGEHVHIWQPDSESARHLFKKNKLDWKCVEKGNVKTVFKGTTKTDIALVTIKVIAYEKMKKLTYEVTLDELTLPEKKQLRLMFPMAAGKVSYEVPFAQVVVGQDETLKKFSKFNPNKGNFDLDKHSDNEGIRPREVQNYIACENDKFMTMISTYNLAWDYQDPTKEPIATPVLQPILMSTSKSCHWEYGHWLQNDSRTYSFSIFSGTDHNDLCEQAISSNNPPVGIFSQKGKKILKDDSFSLIEFNNPNIVATSIKKSEDDNQSYILRVFNRSHKTICEEAKLAHEIQLAKGVNLIEKSSGEQFLVGENKVAINLGQGEISSYQIKPKKMADMVSPPNTLLAIIHREKNQVDLSWKGNSTTYDVYTRKTDLEKEWTKAMSAKEEKAILNLEDGAYDLCVQGNDSKASSYIEIILRDKPEIK